MAVSGIPSAQNSVRALSTGCASQRHTRESVVKRTLLLLQLFGRSQSLPGADSLLAKPIDKQHTDTVVNFLIRVACQVRVLNVLCHL